MNFTSIDITINYTYTIVGSVGVNTEVDCLPRVSQQSRRYDSDQRVFCYSYLLDRQIYTGNINYCLETVDTTFSAARRKNNSYI
jgi:hypothetical protein